MDETKLEEAAALFFVARCVIDGDCPANPVLSFEGNSFDVRTIIEWGEAVCIVAD